MPLIIPSGAGYRTSSFTATTNGAYSVKTDSAAISVTLPLSPGQGAVVALVWNTGTNNLTIISQNGNIVTSGNPFGNTNATNLILGGQWSGSTLTFVFDGVNWKIGMPGINSPSTSRNSSFTAMPASAYAVRTDASGAVNVTMPQSPPTGSVVVVDWIRGSNNLTFTSQNGNNMYTSGNAYGDSNSVGSVTFDSKWTGANFVWQWDGASWLLGVPAVDQDARYNSISSKVMTSGSYYQVGALGQNQGGRVYGWFETTDGNSAQLLDILFGFKVVSNVGYATFATPTSVVNGSKIFDRVMIGSSPAYSISIRSTGNLTINASAICETFPYSKWLGTSFLAQTGPGIDYGSAAL